MKAIGGIDSESTGPDALGTGLRGDRPGLRLAAQPLDQQTGRGRRPHADHCRTHPRGSHGLPRSRVPRPGRVRCRRGRASGLGECRQGRQLDARRAVGARRRRLLRARRVLRHASRYFRQRAHNRRGSVQSQRSAEGRLLGRFRHGVQRRRRSPSSPGLGEAFSPSPPMWGRIWWARSKRGSPRTTRGTRR